MANASFKDVSDSYILAKDDKGNSLRKFILTSNVSSIYIPSKDFEKLKSKLQDKYGVTFGADQVFGCTDDRYEELPSIMLTIRNGTESAGNIYMPKELYAHRDATTDQCML